MNAPKNCTEVSISLSSKPQKKATIGIKYVTEVAKTGDEIWINLKNNILAIPVPTTPRIMIYNIDSCIAVKDPPISVSELLLKNPVKYKIVREGRDKIKKLPVVILNGVKSDRYLFIRFTFIA